MGSGTVILSPVLVQDGYGGNLLRVDNNQRVLTDSNVSSTVLPPDAATETTLQEISTNLEDRFVTKGTRTAISVEYPDLLWELKKITRELTIIRRHMEAVTDSEWDPDIDDDAEM